MCWGHAKLRDCSFGVSSCVAWRSQATQLVNNIFEYLLETAKPVNSRLIRCFLEILFFCFSDTKVWSVCRSVSFSFLIRFSSAKKEIMSSLKKQPYNKISQRIWMLYTSLMISDHSNSWVMLKAPPVNPRDYISWTSKISLREGC